MDFESIAFPSLATAAPLTIVTTLSALSVMVSIATSQMSTESPRR
jgi:hypothetical protein